MRSRSFPFAPQVTNRICVTMSPSWLFFPFSASSFNILVSTVPKWFLLLQKRSSKVASSWIATMARLLWRSWPCYQICYPTTANTMLFMFADQELTYEYQFWCQREAVLPVMVASSNIAWTSNHLETASWFHKQIGLKWNVPWKLRFSKHGTNIIEIDIFKIYMDTTFLNSPKSS